MKFKGLFVTLPLALFLQAHGSAMFAQAVPAGSQSKDARRELAIMQEIVKTTVSFVMQDFQRESVVVKKGEAKSFYAFRTPFAGTDVLGFYLHNQGAVFVISTPNFIDPLRYSFSTLAVVAKGKVAEVGKESEAPAAAASNQESRAHQELMLAQERARKREESREKAREEYSKRMTRLEDVLMETMATHGDSLAHLKSSETLTFVIAESSSSLGSEDDLIRSRIISVKKSDITDYKAGRITLEQFKQRVISYKS